MSSNDALGIVVKKNRCLKLIKSKVNDSVADLNGLRQFTTSASAKSYYAHMREKPYVLQKRS